MTTKSKTLIHIIAIMVSVIALAASCSKEPAAKSGKNTKNVSSPAKPKAARSAMIIPAGKGTLTAVRNGPSVTLAWQTDLSGVKIKKIDISRSSSGKGSERKGVASLKQDAVSYKDTLPDENACWYWVKLMTEDGKFQELGPVRVDADKAGPANYAKIENKYKISIIRTDNLATLKWDFPADEYASIKILRAPRPLTVSFSRLKTAATTGQKPKRAKATITSVTTSMEGKSQYTDPLQNPNAEYWYWFRITLKSGSIIDRGPIKAEYTER